MRAPLPDVLRQFAEPDRLVATFDQMGKHLLPVIEEFIESANQDPGFNVRAALRQWAERNPEHASAVLFLALVAFISTTVIATDAPATTSRTQAHDDHDEESPQSDR